MNKIAFLKSTVLYTMLVVGSASFSTVLMFCMMQMVLHGFDMAYFWVIAGIMAFFTFAMIMYRHCCKGISVKNQFCVANAPLTGPLHYVIPRMISAGSSVAYLMNCAWFRPDGLFSAMTMSEFGDRARVLFPDVLAYAFAFSLGVSVLWIIGESIYARCAKVR
ncbi:MAG: hypothetical protein QG604_159 [Candidatus Dependentiae bacterium]|nr:hypothetical protein [Candidatus Dependentiae bacterium]